MGIMKIQSGDLIFVSMHGMELPEAIAESTAMDRRVAYSHVGIIAVESGRVWVLHATRGRGCCRDRLSRFMRDFRGRIDLYRPGRAADTDEILHRACSMYGQPYNDSFSPDEPGWYCSSYVGYAYQHTGLFHPIPMYFGGDGRSVLPYWRAYFRKIGKEIPLGKPGIAPNTLVLQGRLRFLGALRLR